MLRLLQGKKLLAKQPDAVAVARAVPAKDPREAAVRTQRKPLHPAATSGSDLLLRVPRQQLQCHGMPMRPVREGTARHW